MIVYKRRSPQNTYTRILDIHENIFPDGIPLFLIIQKEARCSVNPRECAWRDYNSITVAACTSDNICIRLFFHLHSDTINNHLGARQEFTWLLSSYKKLKTICILRVYINVFYCGKVTRAQGAVSIRKTVLPGMAIPMLKIRRPNGRLIFNMEIAIRR